MVTYYIKDNKKKLLSKDRRSDIVADIEQKFKLWYDDLYVSRQETLKLLKDLYPGYANDAQKLKKVPSTYEQLKTYESAIYRSTYQNYDGIVDIEGQDLRSNNLAGIYKASLVYDYNNINLKATLDEILFDWVTKGEGSAYVNWREDIIQVPEKEIVEVFDETTGLTYEEVQTVMKDVTTFRGVDVKRIDPHNLYYDKSQKDSWDSCGKVYRAFIPIQTILSNTSYNLTAQEIKDLREMVKPNEDIGDLRNKVIDSNIKVIGSKIEVLEFYGDYMVPETLDVVRNAEIVIIAGKYVARMEQSKKPKCPIILGTYLERPDTSRGQSPMKIPAILNDVENMCVDLMMRAWQLNVDPVFLAPKGAFPSYTRLTPGKPIEFEQTILGATAPQKVDFSTGLRGFDFDKFFKDKMEGATGITQYLLGSQEGAVRTASESTYIHAGATMRIAREAYLFQSRIVLPIVKLHALFKKIYDVEPRYVRMPDNRYAEVTDEVRNGNYTFLIGDSQTSVEREAETQKLFQLLSSPAFQSLTGIMDVQTATEFLKWLLNRMNFKETDQIFEIINLNQQFRAQGSEMGVQPENIEGFRQAMMDRTKSFVPLIADSLIEKPKEQEPLL